MLLAQDASGSTPCRSRPLKFHQLQVFRGTTLMAAEYDADPGRFRFWEADEYIDLFVEILRRLRPDLVVERFASEAPPALSLRPKLGADTQRTAARPARKKIGGTQCIPRRIFYYLRRK